MIEPAGEPESILRHRPFVLYWSARTCASMGYQMLGVAVAWQMYALTGSAFDLGLVGLVQFLPAAAFMLVAGQVADRYDRRRLLRICQTVEGLAAAALAAGSIAGWVSKEFLLAAVFVFGVGRAFEAPTQQTLLPNVVSARGRRLRLHHSARDHHRARHRRNSLHLRPRRALRDMFHALPRVGRAAVIHAH
jgi:MFS family permease